MGLRAPNLLEHYYFASHLKVHFCPKWRKISGIRYRHYAKCVTVQKFRYYNLKLHEQVVLRFLIDILLLEFDFLCTSISCKHHFFACNLLFSIKKYEKKKLSRTQIRTKRVKCSYKFHKAAVFQYKIALTSWWLSFATVFC